MFAKIKNIYYKDLFLYGFYSSYIAITSFAAVVDFAIGSYFDSTVDFVSVIVALVAFRYYLQTKDRVLASIILFWIASMVIYAFVIVNHFDFSVIFTLLLPMVGFILLPTRKMLFHVGIYFVLLGCIFVYGYTTMEAHPFLYDVRNVTTYIIALLFVIAFGTFYHIAIDQSYIELENANRQKTLLLQEIHHRVKNNLNLVASILGIQKLESRSEEVHEVIEQNRLRLESIAMAHEMLYQQSDLENIEFQRYAIKLARHILLSNSGTEHIRLHISMIPLKLPIDAMVQFGIIINELMTNTIKYAFKNGEGTISLSLRAWQGGYCFTYADNGRGMGDLGEAKGFGSRLIEMSVQQLEAQMEIFTQDGVRYEVQFGGEV